MPQRHRSQRSRRSALVSELRNEGWTWVQIAARIAEGEHVNMRVAFRLAHGSSQAQVARFWNEYWPGQESRAGITDKTISYWETWPQSGHEPSLRTLKRLAQLYQCDVGDLIDDGKYGHLDERQQAGGQAYSALALPAGAEAARRVSPLSQAGQLAEEFAPIALVLGGSLPAGIAERCPVPPERLWRLAGEQGGSPLQREAFYEHLVQFPAMWADTMKRRELLRILGWAATAAAATPLFPGSTRRNKSVLLACSPAVTGWMRP